jgi:hypothetical protein
MVAGNTMRRSPIVVVTRWLAPFGLGVVLMAGCTVVTVAPAQPQPEQEHCPYDGAHMNSAKSECPYEIMGQFLQSVSDYAHKRWDPQRRLSDPNPYVEKHGGRALMAVLGVRINSMGTIDEVGLHRSSGVERIDNEALYVFHRGDSVLYPPACALREGAVRFRVGLCVEVVRGGEPRTPIIQIKEAPRKILEPSVSVPQ